jgi:UPF0716 protein FxsA
MQIGLILLALAFPLLELAVMIKVGQWLGLWQTLLLLLAAGLGGGLIIQAQGMSAGQRAARSLQEGRAPLEPVVDSFMLMIAGFLLAVPGLISDAMAVPLLIPPLRKAIAGWGLRRLLAHAEVHVQTHVWQSQGGTNGGGSAGANTGGNTGGSAGGPVIDGEWERVDDPKPAARPIKDDRPTKTRPPQK